MVRQFNSTLPSFNHSSNPMVVYPAHLSFPYTRPCLIRRTVNRSLHAASIKNGGVSPRIIPLISVTVLPKIRASNTQLKYEPHNGDNPAASHGSPLASVRIYLALSGVGMFPWRLAWDMSGNAGGCPADDPCREPEGRRVRGTEGPVQVRCFGSFSAKKEDEASIWQSIWTKSKT